MTMLPGFVQIVALFGAGLTGIAALYFTGAYRRRDDRQRVPVAVRTQRRNAARTAKRNP